MPDYVTLTAAAAAGRLAAGEWPQRCLLVGPDPYLRQQVIQAWRDSLLPDDTARSLDQAHLERPAAAELAAVVAMPPLWARRRLVVATGDRLPDLGAPSPSCCLVVVLDGAAPGRAALERWLGDGWLVDCAPPRSQDEVESWLVATADRLGVGADPAALRLLGGGSRDLGQLVLRLRQLQDYTGGETITAADVAALALPAEISVFDLLRAVADGRADVAWDRLERAYGSGVTPGQALSIWCGQLAQLWLVAASPDRTDRDLAATLGTPEWVVRQHRRHARRWTPAQLDDLLATVAQLDWARKSGRLEDRAALELAVATALRLGRQGSHPARQA